MSMKDLKFSKFDNMSLQGIRSGSEINTVIDPER